MLVQTRKPWSPGLIKWTHTLSSPKLQKPNLMRGFLQHPSTLLVVPAGGALDWYKSDKANLTSWKVFKERITNYFVPPNYRITLVQKWDNLTWQKGQSVSQYSTEIKTLA